MPNDNDFHQISDLFPLDAEGPDFDALVEDIRVNRLIDPITRHRDGRTLDGRRRCLACRKLGIDPAFTIFEGSDAEALAFVISKNLRRRHLDASQRAMIAAKLATMGRGGDRRSEDFKASIGALNDAQAAKLMGVSERSVERAKTVRRDADPALIQAVEDGRISVSSALNIAGEEPARQRRIATGEEPLLRLAPPPKPRPDDDAGRPIRVTYYEPTEPTTVRVRAYVPIEEPRPRPDIADLMRMAKVSTLPQSFYPVRNFLHSMLPKLPPEEDVAALPEDQRDEFIRQARRRQEWLVELLNLLGAEPERDDAPATRASIK
jgi:hypothetical protein